MADVTLTETEGAFVRDVMRELSGLAGTWTWIRGSLVWKGHHNPDAERDALMAKMEPKENADG